MPSRRMVACACLLLSLLFSTPAAAQQTSPPLAYLEGHKGAVRDVALTPDGKLVITVGIDGTLRLWDRATGENLRTMALGERAILRLALSSDSAWAALTDAGGQVTLLDLPRPYPLQELTGLPSVPTMLTATSDALFVITSDDSQVLRLFDMSKKQPVREFAGTAGGVMGMGLMAESKQLLATSGDGMVRSWNLENGQPGATLALASPSYLAVIPQDNKVALRGLDGALRLAAWPPPTPIVLATHGDQVSSTAMTPDGKTLLWGSLDQQVQLQLEGMPPKALPGAGGRVTSVALAEDGSLAAAGMETGLVKFWKAIDASDGGTLAGHTGAVTSIALHPKQPLLATAGADGTVRIWRHSALPAGWAGHSQPASLLAVSLDGKRALSTGPDLSLRIWTVADGQQVRAWEKLPQAVTAARFTDDGESVVLGDAAGSVSLRKIADGQVAWNFGAHSGPVSQLALLADGQIATTGPDGVVKLWQVSAIGSATRLPVKSTITAALAVGEGSSLLTGSSDGQVTVMNLQGGKELKGVAAFSAPVAALAANADRTLVVAASTGGEVTAINLKEQSGGATLSAGSVRAIAVHPQQPKFATAGEDGLIRLWNVPQPPQVLALHKAPVGVTAVSPDGKQAASGDAGGAVRRWNLPDATDAGLLSGGKEAVRAAVYRRDGQELATGDAAGVVRLFSATEGTTLGTIGAHDGGVTGLSFHPNHTQLLSSGADGMLRLWQLPLVPPREVSKLASQARAIASTADGNTMVVGGDKSVAIVDLGNGQERASIQTSSAVTAVAVSPDNAQTAFVTGAGTLHVAALADGKPIADLGAHLGAVSAVAYRPQAGQIATVGSDGHLRLWELPVTPRFFSDHTDRITAVAVSPNGQLLATASADKTVRLWNLADGSASWTLGHDDVVTAIAWKPDNSQIAAATGKQVRIWNMADGQQAQSLDKHTGNVAAVVFSPDGASLYTAGAAQTIQQWNLADGSLVRTVGDHDRPIKSLALLAGGATLISASEEGVIRTWNTATGARLASIAHGGAPTALAASGDGKWLAVAGPEKTIRLYDLADGGIAQSITGLAAPPDCLAFSLDLLSLAGGSAEGTVRIWNLQGQLQEFIPSADNAPTALAFLPDHRQLAVGGQKSLVRVHRRALVKALSVSQSPLTSLAWSADGQFVLTAASDKTLKLWNAADGNPARQFFGQADVPRSVTITKDGTKVIAGCDDKSLRVWNFSDGNLLATLLLESAPQAIAASSDGAKISAAEKTTLRVWDLASQRTIERFDMAATALAMLPDGKGLLAGDAAGTTRRLTIAGTALAIAHGGAAASAAISNDGQRWFSAGSDKTVKAWDPAGKPLLTLGSCDGAPAALAVRPDGLQVAVAGADRQIHLWRLDNNQPERKIPAAAAVVSLAYHPSLPKLAAACTDGMIRVFNPTDGMLLEIVPAAKIQAVSFAADRLLSAHADHALRLHASSLERIVPGHQGAVTSLIYAADGNSFFSGGVDKTVRQWNSADGAAVRTVATAAEAITGLVLSPDGTRLLAASADKTIRVHNVADGAAVSTFTSPVPLRSLAIDAGGRLLATSSDDGQIRIWDAKTGSLNETIVGAASPASALLFSSDAQQVIAAHGDKSLSVWPLACRTMFPADPTKIHDLTATADGNHFVTSGEDKIVKLWDKAGTLVRVFAGSAFPLRSAAVRPDGAQVAAGGDPGQSQPQLWVWNAADAQLQFNVNLPAAISRVMYLDSQRIAVACTDQKVRVLKASDGKLLEEIALPPGSTAMACAGESLLAAAADNLIHRVQPALVQVIAAHEGGANAVVWSADGQALFSGGADKLVRQWDAVSGKPLRTLSGLSAASSSLAVAADGKSVLACCGDQQVQIWELPAKPGDGDGEIPPTRALAHSAPVRSVALSRDGTRIVTGSDDGLVRVLEAKSGKEIERFAGHTGAVPTVATSGDGRVVISGGADRTARRFDASIEQMVVAPDGTTALALSADGKQILSASSGGKVTAWSAADLSRIRDFEGSAGPIRGLATTPQGDLLVAGGDDSHVRIWSASEGSLLVDLNTHAPISAVSFASEGSLLIVANADGILRHYEISRSGGKLELLPFLMARGHTGAVRGLSLSADGRLAVSVGADSRLLSWRITAGKPRWSRPLSTGPIHDAAFRSDGKELAAAGADGQVHVLSTDNGATLRQWKAHDGPALALAWRPDGQELASAGRDDAIRIWNLEGGEAAKITAGISGPVQAIGWSPDGGLVQAGGRGKVWQSFQRANQQSVREAQGHNHPIVALRYSASGQRVATLDDSGKLFVWDAASGTPLFHQQLPVAAAYRLAWSPDASEIFVASSDPRVLRTPIPAAAR